MPTLPVAAFGFGGGELILILAILLLLFGGAKLPSLAKGLGQSIKEFKKASRDDEPERSSGSADKKPESKPESANTHGSN